MSQPVAIEVVGARTHNLKGIDCRFPHRQVTVVTGPSGAGKSSLAFDTLFAEGQRRFVESMSTYTRQFLAQMERPPVDAMHHVLPSVALEARNTVRNARSTVGTITEIYDVMRLLFAHLGEVNCPEGHGPGRRLEPEAVAADLESLGARATLVVRLARPRRGAAAALGELIRQGYARRLDEEERVERMEPGARWPRALDPLPLVLGRFGTGASPRLVETLERGLGLGSGLVEARGQNGVRFYRRGLGCVTCGRALSRPVPALFSFNSPLGACSTCQGFGRVIGIDRGRVIPNPGLSLAQRPIAPWNTPAYEDLYAPLVAACRRRRVRLDVPFEELSAEDREWVWSGSGSFTNLERFFAWLERRSYRVHVRVLLARYRAYTECPACFGQRLKPEALAVRLKGERLPALTERSVEELRRWLRKQRFTRPEREAGKHLLEQLEERLDVLYRVGLGYLSLDRQARTLSGGETQRIHLAAALGSGLTDTLYVLDEPTVGLHPQDSAALLALLRELAGRGNTVVVVEHDPVLIRGADHIIDLGPTAGARGGEVMVEGDLEQVLQSEASLTARYLDRRPSRQARRHVAQLRREQRARGGSGESPPQVTVEGARAHNLRGLSLSFPLGQLVTVTGVSGSGKSTLVENVLYGNFKRRQGAVDVEPGECDALLGLDAVEDVILVDQRPLGRSSRSNPVTYVKAYDEIRKLYAAQPEAGRGGVTAAHFSFNLERGRCRECQGTGQVEVDMHFMEPVTVVCDRCQGHRFQPQVLAVRYRGRTIAETLELTVSEALETFGDQPRLCRRLQSLVDVGLGYLALGQTTATLSGGEAQRLKLASFLGNGRRRAAQRRRLFLFDEPTTGLHFADIDLLFRTLRRLLDQGDGVVVVEHNLELISRAEWVIDLGPGGGAHGGRLLYCGPLEPFLERGKGATAEQLRAYFSEDDGGDWMVG